MAQLLIQLPTWGLTRLFGITAYVMIFLGISLGILYSFPTIKGPLKAKIYRVHTILNNGGVLFALAHALILIIDTYMPFTWRGLLIPFAAKQNAFLNGIGTIALYGFLILVFTSDIRKKLKRQLWHTIHIMAYPFFLIAFVHGYFLGTDSTNPIMGDFYFASIMIPTIMVIVRMGLKGEASRSKRLTRSRY